MVERVRIQNKLDELKKWSEIKKKKITFYKEAC